ncbi:MAG: TonB-dependent receptor [Rubrivivax sp.]
MNNLSWMAFSRSAVSAAVAIVVAAPVLAQNTTSAVGGRVVDAEGKGVAGANVAILHVDSGSLTNATTDGEGRYVARGLRVGGPYTITISKGGQTDRRDGVFLNLAETLNHDSTLGAPVTTITITGSGAGSKFNSSSMGAGTSIGSRELQAQASIQRNLQDYARNDPRLSQTDKERGEISAAGQNSRFNSITIDGVTTSDTFGLESNNLPTAKQPISIDAIQSVQVNISNYDVTQKGYTGANINAVTKSGTNEFKGSVYYVYRDDSWTGQRYDRARDTYTPAAPFSEKTIGFTLGGPIIQDKLFFFASYEDFKSSKTSPAFSPIGGSQANVGITQSAINSLQTTAKNVYGIDLGGVDVPQGMALTVKDSLLKLDWNISDDHRASLRYAKTEQSEPFFSNLGTRALSLSSHWYNQEKTIETLVGQWFADWSPTLSTEFKVSQRNYDSAPRNNANLPLMMFDFSGSVPSSVGAGSLERTLYTGTERSRHYNELHTKTTDVYAGATWTLGGHELKFGGDLSKNNIVNGFLQDAYGQYKFQCQDGYAYTTVTLTGGNCANATTAEIEAAVIENFAKGRATSYQVQLPQTGKTLADGIATFTLGNVGAFVQDTMKLSKDFSLMAGLRMDQTRLPDAPQYNANAAAPMVAGNVSTNTRQSGGFGYDNTTRPDGATLLQPRIGFNWNLSTPERRMQLRGGFGLFEGAAATVWLSNAYSNPGVATAFYGCGTGSELISGTNRPACDPTVPVFRADPNGQLRVGTTPAANVDFLDPSLRQPSIWKANLAFETELPWGGLVAGAEWLYTKTKSGIYYKHLNLGGVTRTGPDGRELFYNENGYKPDCWNTAGVATPTVTGCGTPASPGTVTSRALSNLSYGQVLLATGTEKGGGNTLTLSLSQPVRNGLSWGAAYTRSAAKEVSPLTSSVANSNFNARSVFNPNEEVAANSAYLVRDRVNANLTYSNLVFSDKYRTTFGVFYEGRTGKPYSWTFNNDMNGDGVAGNDLMYIPKGPGSGEVEFAGQGEAAFWNVVNNYEELSNSRGGVVKRNGSYSPFVNSFDMRFSQEFGGFTAKHKASFTVDILNIGNLINRRWGRTNEVAFQSAGGQARSFVNYKGINAAGQYVYSVVNVEDYVIRQEKYESQWAAQVTLRYEF